MSKELKILGAIAIVVVIGAIIGTSFYRSSTENERITTTNSNTNKTIGNIEALIRPDSPTLGTADAKVTIVEFLDPECEACSAFNPIVKKTLKAYEGKVRLVVRYMPLHPNSLKAATFLEEAGEQGKYWQALDYLFQKQPEWGTRHGPTHGAPQPDVNVLFKKYTTDLGLDAAKMESAFAQNKYASKIERDKKDGQALGVRQTPTLFINGRKLGRLDEMGLRYLIEDELKK